VARPDVLHLGQNDLPVPAARAIVGADVIIGRSTHAPHEVDMAVAAGVDYFCVGPVWTAEGQHTQGRQLMTYAVGKSTGQPWFAMGGITPGNLDELLDAGVNRVVVDRAITRADDPAGVAKEFARRLRAT